MAERVIDPRLQELFDKNIPVYSISRLNTFHHCPYEFYLHYCKGVEGRPNVWAELGGGIHDALEATVHGAEMGVIKEALNKTLDDLDMRGIEFPLDPKGNPTLRANWIANMSMFAENFKGVNPNGNYETEQLIIYKTPRGHYVQGYIDLIQICNDGTLNIFDWKTSSDFKGGKLQEAGRQLILYALAKQQEGFDVKRIAWVMLKYCTITWPGVKKPRHKKAEWRNWVKAIEDPLNKMLIDRGIDDVDVDFMVQEAIENNSLSGIPKDVADKFELSVYVRDYELSDEIIEETLNYLDNTIEDIESRGEASENFESCDIMKESFYCASLCGYGGKEPRCGEYAEWRCGGYLEDDDEDLFGM